MQLNRWEPEEGRLDFTVFQSFLPVLSIRPAGQGNGTWGQALEPGYHALNVCVSPLPNPYVKALTLNIKVLKVETFGRYLGLDEAMRVEPHNEISALKEEEETRVFFSSPREDIARKQCLQAREILCQKQKWLASWSRMSQPPEQRNECLVFCFGSLSRLSH